MRMKYLSLLAAAGTLLMVGGAATSASAQIIKKPTASAGCCGYYDYGYEDGGNNFVIGQLTERINAMELAIIEALRLGTGQVSGNLKEQIGADSNLANAQDDRSVVGKIEEARFNAMEEAASASQGCNVMTYARGGSSVAAGSLAYSSDLAEGMQNWDNGTDGMPRSTAEAISERVRLQCDLYANEQDIRSGMCPEAQVGELSNASTSATKSIFYVEQGTMTFTLAPERAKAAHAFMVNALNPFPVTALLPEQANSPGGQELATRKMADTSRMSVANDAWSYMAGKRTGQASESMVATARATAQNIDGYQGNFDNGLSWQDYMDIRSRGWLFNQDFLGKLNGASGVAVAIKDGVQIQAYDAYLNWETYLLMEKQTAILATMLAIQVEQAREP